MPSYSATLKQEVAKARADDCAQLTPHVLPKSVQAMLARIEDSLPEEPAAREAALAALTPDQRAALDWFNDDIAEAQNHSTYCNKGT